MEINEEKPSKFKFHFPEVLVPFSMLKKRRKNSALLDLGDNPIYPISDPDGQEQGLIFWGENVDYL